MKNLGLKITKLLLILVLFTLCKSCTEDYINGPDKGHIADLEKIIADNTVTEAEYFNEYTEKTVKILKVPVKTYVFDYSFTVNNQVYKGTRSLKELPEYTNFPIYYLFEDPEVNTPTPEEDLKLELEKVSSKSNLYWAIGWAVIALFFTFSLIKDMKTTLQKNKPKTRT